MKREKNAEMTPPARSRRRAFKVGDDELHPLTRAYRTSGEQPPPLPGRAGIVALAEATFIVRDDELRPMTRAEWVQAPKRVARQLAKLAS